MINVLALYLVLSSLVTATVLSPSKETHNPKDDVNVIVKEGHRVVIVEYENEGDDGNTKISISPPQQDQTHVSDDDKTYVSAAKEKLSTAAATKKEAVEEASSVVFPEEFSQTGDGRQSPRELVCDALGKCKHKIASAVGKAKEKVSETAPEVEEQAKDVAGEAIGKAKKTVAHKTDEVSEIAKETAEKAKTIGRDVQRNVSTTVESAKEKAKEKAEQGKEMAEQAAERAKTGAYRMEEGGKKWFQEIFWRGRVAAAAAAMGWVVDVVHLLGFSMAYGICLWVTFVSSYVLAGSLPRQQFGMVQSRIYPVYFRVVACGVGLALVGHLLGRRERLFSDKGELFQVFHLLVSLAMVLINALYLEPGATKVMFERMKLEKEEGRGRIDHVPTPPARGTADTISTLPPSTPINPDHDKVKSRIAQLNEKLKKLNAYSSLLNVLTLMALTWHLVYLGQRLHLSC